MNLVKTSLLSLASTAVKMLAGLAISKTLAIYVGPSGLAIVGQFQNFIQLALTAAKGGLDTGITKYTAEYGQDEARLSLLFGTALRICAACCALVAVVLVAAAEPLSQHFLHSGAYAYVMRLFGATIGLFVLNSLLLAILNGLQAIRTYIVVNIMQSVFTLVLTTALIVSLGVDGALIALVTNQSLVLFVVLWKLRRHPVIRVAAFRGAFDPTEAKRLSKYALMAVISAIASPLTSILVRDHITRTIGLNEAGYWQGMWYISSTYLTVVTTSLSIYYLPKLSATTDRRELRAELVNGYAIIMPIMMAAALSIYVARELVIRILFTAEFTPMLVLFRWMLIGDVVKLASWLVAYLMLAKAMTSAFIFTEVVFSASFVLLSMVLTDRFGLVGVTYAHALNYSTYLLAVAVLTRRFWL
jgi:O-antigen/teichoic acid export membrane protein